MATRILIQVDNKDAPASLPQDVQEVLAGAGATDMRPSHRELPGLFTAVLPDQADVKQLLEALKKLPGVRHAEADTFRSTL